MISIIIPVYKVEDYLRECLDSVLAQTYTDFEVICVNDGSPDNCHLILEEYGVKDNRFKIISFEKNQGLSVVRNIGIENARGEYIAFVDSDDKIAPEYLENLVSHIDGVDCVEVGLKYFTDDKELLDLDGKQLWFDKYLFNKQGIFEIKPSIFKCMSVGVWNKLYRRDIIEKYNVRFIKDLFFEDQYFCFAYICHCKNIYEVGKKFYYYRKRKGSICNSKRDYEHYFDEMKNYIAFAEHLVKYGFDKKFRLVALWGFLFNSFCESRILCDRAVAINLIKKFANTLSFNQEKFLAYVEPKVFGIKVQDVSNETNKIKIIKSSENIKRVYGKNNVVVKSCPKTFSFEFKTEKPAMLKIFFGVLNFQISCYDTDSNIKVFVKEIFINGQKIGENILLNKETIPSIMVRSSANTKTIIDVKF